MSRITRSRAIRGFLTVGAATASGLVKPRDYARAFTAEASETIEFDKFQRAFLEQWYKQYPQIQAHYGEMAGVLSSEVTSIPELLWKLPKILGLLTGLSISDEEFLTAQFEIRWDLKKEWRGAYNEDHVMVHIPPPDPKRTGLYYIEGYFGEVIIHEYLHHLVCSRWLQNGMRSLVPSALEEGIIELLTHLCLQKVRQSSGTAEYSTYSAETALAGLLTQMLGSRQFFQQFILGKHQAIIDSFNQKLQLADAWERLILKEEQSKPEPNTGVNMLLRLLHLSHSVKGVYVPYQEVARILGDNEIGIVTGKDGVPWAVINVFGSGIDLVLCASMIIKHNPGNFYQGSLTLKCNGSGKNAGRVSLSPFCQISSIEAMDDYASSPMKVLPERELELAIPPRVVEDYNNATTPQARFQARKRLIDAMRAQLFAYRETIERLLN